MAKKVKKRTFVITNGEKISKETKELVKFWDKVLQDNFDNNVVRMYGLDFHLITDFCPVQYEIYKDDKYVAYFRFRGGCITVRPIIDTTDTTLNDYDLVDYDRCIYEKCLGDLFTGSFKNEKQRMKILREVAIEINDFLATGKTKEEIEYEKNPNKDDGGFVASPFFEILAENFLKSIKEEQEFKPLKYNPPKTKLCDLIESQKESEKDGEV